MRKNSASRITASSASLPLLILSTPGNSTPKNWRGPLIEEQMPFALVYNGHRTMLRVTIVKEVPPAGYTGARLGSAG